MTLVGLPPAGLGLVRTRARPKKIRLKPLIPRFRSGKTGDNRTGTVQQAKFPENREFSRFCQGISSAEKPRGARIGGAFGHRFARIRGPGVRIEIRLYVYLFCSGQVPGQDIVGHAKAPGSLYARGIVRGRGAATWQARSDAA